MAFKTIHKSKTKKMEKKETAAGGVTFTGLLLLLFIGLKLTGAIGWSWWWVFSPVWIPLVILILIFLVVYAANWLGGKFTK